MIQFTYIKLQWNSNSSTLSYTQSYNGSQTVLRCLTRRVTFMTCRLVFVTCRLMFMSRSLVFVTRRLVFFKCRLTFMFLRIIFVTRRLVFFKCRLTFMFLRIIFVTRRVQKCSFIKFSKCLIFVSSSQSPTGMLHWSTMIHKGKKLFAW